MIGVPWGTQVRASVVDTGSRGRLRGGDGGAVEGLGQGRNGRDGRDGDRGGGKKRKREGAQPRTDGVGVGADEVVNVNGVGRPGEVGPVPSTKAPVQASTGFLHILAPTPERWTTSLPHRTQIVYTPDYSYILHRLRVRPGSVVIEAGSGSGSFTHAAARSCFNGYKGGDVASMEDGGGDGHVIGNGEDSNEAVDKDKENAATAKDKDEVEGKNEKVVPAGEEPERPRGHVYTYEFHAERQRKLEVEISEHGLTDIVTSLHRDVYRDGFLHLPTDTDQARSAEDVATTAETPPKGVSVRTGVSPKANAIFLDLPAPWTAFPHLRRRNVDSSPSPLDPQTSVHLCCFMPCIEQVTRTVATLRREGWVDVEMVEMMHKRIDVRREYTGYEYDGMRGVNGGVAGSVDEAVRKLRDVEGAARRYRELQKHNNATAGTEQGEDEEDVDEGTDSVKPTDATRQTDRKLVEENQYKSGQLVHRSEPELKTHTSYLVFAILPREWTEGDELRARENLKDVLERKRDLPKSQRTLKKEAKRRKKVNGAKEESRDVAPGAEEPEAVADVMMDEN